MTLKEKIAKLPDTSGVYIYRDASAAILYVGKAKSLKNRVKQYFAANVHDAKVKALVEKIADMEYIVTRDESDALALENNLIKKHKPPYNILLKDDKQYGFIKVSVKQRFPRVSAARKLEKDGCKYFGPYTKGGGGLLDVVNACYATVSCNYDFEHKKVKPCLAYHINTCPAPCVNKVSAEQYRQTVDKVLSLLGGNVSEAKRLLNEKMTAAAQAEQYEQAMEYKRLLELLPFFQGGRVSVLSKSVDYDVFGICGDGEQAVCNVLHVRQGKVSHSQNYTVTDAGLDESQTLSSFIMQYYDDGQQCKTVLTSVQLSDADALGDFLSVAYGERVSVTHPQRGDKKKLCDMSRANAQEYLIKNRDEQQKEYLATEGAMKQLAQVLILPTLPRRIECYDISNVSGVDKVASMIVFINGKAANKEYRRFRIKTVEGADDFASMQEVITRRLKRLKEGDVKFGAKPDLIVVDGGKGQLSSARAAFEEVGIYDVGLVSLAKKEEIVFTLDNNEGIRMPHSSHGLKLLINARDEAHRFAITYFRQLHGKNALKSVLADIPGIGKKRQIELVRHFVGVDVIAAASVEELSQVNGMNTASAQAVYDYFHKYD